MQKFDPVQASLKVAAVGGIFMIRSNFTIEAGIFFQLHQKKKLGNPAQKSCVKIAKNFMMMTSITCVGLAGLKPCVDIAKNFMMMTSIT